MSTEQEILERLAVAQREYEYARQRLIGAKKTVVVAETESINHKIHMEKIEEELRVHRATTMSAHPEIESRVLEIDQFRQDNPEVCAMAKQRDLDKP